MLLADDQIVKIQHYLLFICSNYSNLLHQHDTKREASNAIYVHVSMTVQSWVLSGLRKNI